MAGLNLWVQVVDADQVPLEGAQVVGELRQATDATGNATITVVWLTVTKDGYTPYVDQPYTSPDGAAPIVIGLAEAPPEPTPPDPVPPPVALPELEIRGHCFQQASVPGHGPVPWTAIQCSDFNLLNRWQHGEDISGVLAQRLGCGFNLLRVWTAYDIGGIGTFLDLDYSRIPAFVGLCASYGLYVEFCAYTGINDPAHWPQLCDAARLSSPRPLLELVNELDQNTNEPDPQGRVFRLADYPRPSGLLVSRGSNGSEHPPVGNDWVPAGTDQWAFFGMTEPLPAFWDYTTMHYNDAFEWPRKVGHNSMEIWSGPTLANENTRYNDKCGNQVWAYDAAAGAALLCAGSCFHSVAGKTSERWVGEEEQAATQWAAGGASVRLAYQDGAYKHPAELETPELLRVYQRVYPDDRGAETVEIHK